MSLMHGPILYGHNFKFGQEQNTKTFFKNHIAQFHHMHTCTLAPTKFVLAMFNILQLNDLFFNGSIHRIVNNFDFDGYSYKKRLFTNKFMGEFMSLLHGTFLYRKIVCHSTCIITLKMNMKYKVIHACKMGYTFYK